MAITPEQLADAGITQENYKGWLIRYWRDVKWKIAFNVRPEDNESDVYYPKPMRWPGMDAARTHAQHMIDTITVVEPDTIVIRRKRED